MPNRKRPSAEDVASTIGAAVPKAEESQRRPQPSPALQDVEWQKYTVFLRSDQLDELRELLAVWMAEKKVKISLSEVARLALDGMIARMKEDPDQTILELYRQEQRELAANENRKFSPSHGLQRYLQQAGKL